MAKNNKYGMTICIFVFVYAVVWGISGNTIRKIFGISFLMKPPADNNSNYTKSTCQAIRGIVYLKTHKTGSTSLFEILQNHLERQPDIFRNKTSQIDPFPFPFYGGYPGYFQKELTVYRNDSIPDTLMGHFRFDEKEVKTLMAMKVKYITIMRNPLDQFESSFHYYYGNYTKLSLQKKNEQSSIVCHGQPYLQVAGKFGESYSNYIKLADNALFDQMAWFFRSRNSQSFDLGLDPWNNSQEYLLDEANKLNSTFDLVLILEHLLESLVLLKDLLCMEWSDIIPEENNKGSYEPHKYTNKEKEIIRKLTTQDLALYNFFNQTLWRKVDKYGREKMKNDVAILENLLSGQNKSSERKRRNPTNNFIDGNRRKRSIVQDRNSSNIQKYLQEIAEKGGFYIEKNFIQKFSDYMIENSGWCPSIDIYLYK